jgi:hypothetical protein
MTDELLRKVRVDVQRESYFDFLSDDWGERVLSLTQTKPQLHVSVRRGHDRGLR